MKRFWDSLVRPLLDQCEPRVLLEIGSFKGANTSLLLDYCRDHDAVLHAIDPLPQFDVDAWQAEYGRHFVFHRAKSLDVLSSIEPVDVALIDGDHNWYTVYHELNQLAAVASQHERSFPIALFHDIGWPYARRDLYYDPDDIPAPFRQPFEVKGILPRSSALQPLGLNYKLHNATHEGGPRNGVLTAVDDFMAESDEPMQLILIDGFHGLGVLYPESLAERAPNVAAHLNGLTAGLAVLGQHLRNVDQQMIRLRVRMLRLRHRLAKLEAKPVADEPEDE